MFRELPKKHCVVCYKLIGEQYDVCSTSCQSKASINMLEEMLEMKKLGIQNKNFVRFHKNERKPLKIQIRGVEKEF